MLRDVSSNSPEWLSDTLEYGPVISEMGGHDVGSVCTVGPVPALKASSPQTNRIAGAAYYTCQGKQHPPAAGAPPCLAHHAISHCPRRGCYWDSAGGEEMAD